LLIIHAPAAIVLGHIDLVTIFGCAAEAELQGNGLADVELPLISRNRDFEHNPGIDRWRRLSARPHYGNSHQQEKR
jgi:hypothetical protein